MCIYTHTTLEYVRMKKENRSFYFYCCLCYYRVCWTLSLLLEGLKTIHNFHTCVWLLLVILQWSAFNFHNGKLPILIFFERLLNFSGGLHCFISFWIHFSPNLHILSAFRTLSVESAQCVQIATLQPQLCGGETGRVSLFATRADYIISCMA